MPTYLTLVPDLNPDFCFIGDVPDEMDYSYRLARGMRTGKRYDPAIPLRMDSDMPGKLVPDIIPTASHLLLVKQRIKEILEQRARGEVEYFPFTLLDHKKKVTKEPLWIVNPIGWVDCVDRSKTIGNSVPSAARQEAVTAAKKGLPKLEYDDKHSPQREYVRLRKLVLVHRRIPSKLNFFRLFSKPDVIVFRKDIHEALVALRPTGAHFVATGGALCG